MKELKELIKLEEYDFPGIGKKQFTDKKSEIYKTRDGKGIFLKQEENVLVHYPTKVGIPAYYEFKEAAMPKKIKAVLMDLDGTSIKSEEFWIWVIEEIIRRLRGEEGFKFSQEDLPFVSGYSVSEHLDYVLNKYCTSVPGADLPVAQKLYFEIVREELDNILRGEGRKDAFIAAPYLKEFLLELKKSGVKIGVVSSGLYEKAWPEMKCVFDALNLGDPLKLYDAIITAGFPIEKGSAGTMGELAPKPHPWLYAEALFALQVDSCEAIALEDSGAGVLSARSAGIATIGLAEGNIEAGGERGLCSFYGKDLKEVLEFIKDIL